jgi:hypothetical protein
MPTIIPRQIIEAINIMFGPLSELVQVPDSKQSEVRTLLGLLDQLQPDFITLPFHEFLEFERCRAALASTLPRWNRGGSEVALGVGGKNPVELIRRLLARCTDELPPPEPEFPFVTDDDVRLGVEDRVRAAWLDFNAREWLGATTSAAVALESVLLWEVKRLDKAVGEAAHIGKRKKDPDEMRLTELINEARASESITEETAKQADLARDARNLVHPGKVARSGTSCSKATALAAFAGLYRIAEELNRAHATRDLDRADF